MTDIITYCDINTCEECPRYGDDCDGDKYLDRYPTMHEYAEGKRINPKLTDLISRADAVNEIHKYFVAEIDKTPTVIDEDGDELYADMTTVNSLLACNKELSKRIKALPSADVEPTVIRSRKLLPTKDFKEWAKRIREVNPNAVVIPCDAEVVSSEAEWIPCSERLPKEDEYVGNVCKYYLIQDEYGDMHVAHLSGRGWETIESVKALGCDVVAWQPLPKSYREDGEA